MFEVLVSSRMPRPGGGGRSVVSGVVHAGLIAAAVRVTAQVPQVSERPRVEAAVFLAPPRAEPAAVEPLAGVAVVGAPEAVLPPAPTEVPGSIPPVVLGPALDPEALRRVVAKGIPAGPAGVVGSGPTSFAEAEVDEPASIVSQPAPRYPSLLQAARLEGRVVVEFIIDTTGHIERGSLRVVASSHPGFEGAAMEALGRSVFQPARIRGRPVRQRAVQAVSFRFDQGASASAPVEVSLTRKTSVSP